MDVTGGLLSVRPLTDACHNAMQEPENMNDAWRAASVSDIDGSSPRTVGDGAVYEEEDAALIASDAPVPSGVTSACGHHCRPAAMSLTCF